MEPRQCRKTTLARTLTDRCFNLACGGRVGAVFRGEVEEGHEVIEIKLASAPNPEDLARLDKVAGMIQATRSVLLRRVRELVTRVKRWVVNLSDYLEAATASNGTSTPGRAGSEQRESSQRVSR